MPARPLIGISTRLTPPLGTLALPYYAVANTYVRSVRQAGGVPLLLPPVLREQEQVLARLDGLVLSGGGDIAAERYGAEPNPLLEKIDRERDQAELALARLALRMGKPTLAICRGIQVLNVATGGTLYADITTQVPDALRHRPGEGQPATASAHLVRIEPGSRLRAILELQETTVNSFHHQAVRAVGAGLAVTARAPDGVIEGLELPDHPFFVGVQWHPEMAVGNERDMGVLFLALVRAARTEDRQVPSSS